ncbi:ATP-binding protein [Pseudomonas sp. 22526]|uniref:ATP-binding protein n=1 Tax=Pseudomonas sp. 22526 TaxID=3453937 RepID=UPI003F82C916
MTTIEDNIDREAHLENHPVVSTHYTLITPMIAKVYSILRERVFSRHTGTFLYAKPRMGKTRCAETVRDLLTIEFPKKYILYHTADGNKSARLIRDLVSTVGLYKAPKESYGALMERFIIHVRAEVEFRGGGHFVFIVDENQLLSTEGWNELLVIHNRLEQRGISMTTLGFGQEEILENRHFLFGLGATNLVARFLCEPIRFEGCVSEVDFDSMLNEYDANKEFPLDSGCTYTNFFLPKAFAAGFRISKYSRLIWTELINVAGEDGPGELPLEHMFRVIEDILMRSRHMDCSEFKITDEIVRKAVDASLIVGYVSFMRQAPK